MLDNAIDKHTFVICAYKKSAYLEECIKSLLGQSVKSNIIMVSSTPNEHIEAMAKKHDIKLYINEGVSGIGPDWNFGLSKTTTKYVTIAHQDDVYAPDYLKECLVAAGMAKAPIITFTDYSELRNGEPVDRNTLLAVKRLMLFPLQLRLGAKRLFARSVFVRRRILSMGNPICCPSVMYNMDMMKGKVFNETMGSNLDWETWEKLSRYKGSFVYCHKKLTFHRIHESSTTSKFIEENNRSKEDYEMFCKFWPKWIARLILRWYSSSQKSNSL